jgi:hypothetical protein
MTGIRPTGEIMADNEQASEPMMAGSGTATDDEKLNGIIEQEMHDSAGQPVNVVLAKLQGRIEASGVVADDAALADAARIISERRPA